MNIIRTKLSWWEWILYGTVVVLFIAFCIDNAVLKGQQYKRDGKAHIFNLAEPIVTYADRYEYIGEYRLTGYFPQEGEIVNCVGKNLVPGDVAISQDIPLQYGDRVIIEKLGVGIIEGEHIVKDKTACWVKGTIDVYVRNPYLASAITGTCRIWRVR